MKTDEVKTEGKLRVITFCRVLYIKQNFCRQVQMCQNFKFSKKSIFNRDCLKLLKNFLFSFSLKCKPKPSHQSQEEWLRKIKSDIQKILSTNLGE